MQSEVVSCEGGTLEIKNGGKKNIINGYNVILTDTILFPEGGGQPDDKGTLDGQEVLKVYRSGQNAVHFVASPVPVGKEVKTEIDWKRRFDHMQQHSGQHLITAITEELYGYKTASWWLGEKYCYIEMETSNISDEEKLNIEKTVNNKIREAQVVTIKIFQPGESIPEDVRTFKEGLPADWKGPIRLIHMGDENQCLCCGTHVSNLSQLQAVKLLHCEKGKKKNSLLYFLCGDRLLNYLTDCIKREDSLSACLNNGPTEHLGLVEKLQKSAKISQKTVQTLLKDCAESEVTLFKKQNPLPNYFILHKKEGSFDFMNAIVRGLSENDVILFLTVGDDDNGQFLIYGKEQTVNEIGPKICDILQGKGSGKKGRFQGKIGTFKNKKLADEIITSHIALN